MCSLIFLLLCLLVIYLGFSRRLLRILRILALNSFDDLTFLGLLVNLDGKLLNVAFKNLNGAIVLALVGCISTFHGDERRLVEVAECASEAPAEHWLVVVLVLVLNALRRVHIRQDRIDEVVQLLQLAYLDVAVFSCDLHSARHLLLLCR